MIDRYIEGTTELLGSSTETELQYQGDTPEEPSTDDRDYFVDQATIDLRADGRATDHLVHLLKKAVGAGDGVEIERKKR